MRVSACRIQAFFSLFSFLSSLLFGGIICGGGEFRRFLGILRVRAGEVAIVRARPFIVRYFICSESKRERGNLDEPGLGCRVVYAGGFISLLPFFYLQSTSCTPLCTYPRVTVKLIRCYLFLIFGCAAPPLILYRWKSN